jgi:hypothetical protein
MNIVIKQERNRSYLRGKRADTNFTLPTRSEYSVLAFSTFRHDNKNNKQETLPPKVMPKAKKAEETISLESFAAS